MCAPHVFLLLGQRKVLTMRRSPCSYDTAIFTDCDGVGTFEKSLNRTGAAVPRISPHSRLLLTICQANAGETRTEARA